MPIPAWFTNPTTLVLVVLACALQLLIARKLPEGMQVLRTHAGFAVFGIALTVLGHWLPTIGPAADIDVLSELAKAGWGILLIRIVCIAFFRLLMPSIGASQPRILHELVFVVATFAWIVVRLRSAGVNLGGIVTTSAAITAILAFSMQETLGNILGGLALQLDKSIHLGDWIQVEGVRGQVTEVRWRHTAIRTTNGELVVIPNSQLMKIRVTVISSAESPVARRTVNFSTCDSVPPQDVIAAVEKALRDTPMLYVAPLPAPDCVVAAYASGSIEYAVRYWLIDQQHDASADSTVRLHILSVLRRHEFPLARPVMDVRVDQLQPGADLDDDEIEHRVGVLAGVPLFAGLHAVELRTVASRVRVTPFMKNDVITRQGAVAHWLYVLVSGEADVWYEARNGERRYVSTLGAGAVFGEKGMMTGAPRSATVQARTDAVCYRIDKESFESILRARPQLADPLAGIMGERRSALEAVRIEDEQPPEDNSTLLDRMRRFFGLVPGDAAVK
jgi:small-conductance mechanosensitive channel